MNAPHAVSTRWTTLRFWTELRHTIGAALLLPPLVFACSTATVIQSLLGARPSTVDWAYKLFSRAVVAIAGAQLFLHGAEHIEPGQSYVVVSNHESNLDPFVIMAALPQLIVRFVIKRQLAWIPAFGQALALTGNVIVYRRGRADMRRVEDALSHRDPRVSLLFFAEGTRARDGRLQTFKKGAFVSAISAQLPVLPIGVAGTYAVLRPRSTWFRPGGVSLEVGAPLPVHADSEREALRDEAFAAVSKLRSQARERLRSAGYTVEGRD